MLKIRKRYSFTNHSASIQVCFLQKLDYKSEGKRDKHKYWCNNWAQIICLDRITYICMSLYDRMPDSPPNPCHHMAGENRLPYVGKHKHIETSKYNLLSVIINVIPYVGVRCVSLHTSDPNVNCIDSNLLRPLSKKSEYCIKDYSLDRGKTTFIMNLCVIIY